MKLLLTNDDGINALGLHILAKKLEKEHDLIIAAPSLQKSASSHSITILNPISIKEVKLPGIKSKSFSIGGTPADCVKVAINKLLDDEIDMVISGINAGTNLGMDVLYSGTVSAAIEAAINKIPSIAMSSEIRNNLVYYESAAEYAAMIISKSKQNFTKEDLVLNVNVPCENLDSIKGLKVCQLGGRIYNTYFDEKINENNETCFYLNGNLYNNHKESTDAYLLRQGYVTLTPLHYDLTNFKILNDVSNWF
ncbi:5'/3'-nucleotidase SurE [Clostridium rectalis]|uniref:5'/3'-nucleotidase SurE n=1 Tax=Clostridium rectalis TaxID=2040295 RepID=UPI000F644F27|nr:5'/3'-nucleotidase SurE [Clostridium rectalis]